MAKHGKTLQESPETLREQVRTVANGVAEHMDEEQLAHVGSAARQIAEGLLESVTNGTPEEVAAKVAMSMGALLALMVRTPLRDVGETCDNTIAGYSLAAGHLVGVYELPAEPGEGDAVATPEPEATGAVKYL